MSGRRTPDEHLRIRALDALGPLGEPLARAALELGSITVEHDVLAWEGTLGTMHGHRVVVALATELHAAVAASHAAVDAIEAALAAAMAERAGHVIADVRIELGAIPPPTSPYRGRP